MNAKGFTLIEMMVVIAILAAMVSFGMPKLGRAAAQAKMFDAVTALTTVGAQVQARCAATGQFPPDFASFAPAPAGYQGIGAGSRACESWSLNAVASADSDLPKICVRLVSGKLKFGAVASASFGADDVPAGRGNVDVASTFCGS